MIPLGWIRRRFALCSACGIPVYGRTVAAACAVWLPAVAGCSWIHRVEAEQHIRRGEAYLASMRFDEALAAFQEAARLAPQQAEPYSRIGTIHRRRGDFERAIDSFLEAVRRDPDSFDDVLNLAQLYHVTRRIAQAIQSYLQAVHMHPDHFEAQLDLGVCYQQAGEWEQAERRFERAIEIDPTRPQSYVNLGVARDSQKKYYAAVRSFKEALELDSRQPKVMLNLARTYMNQDRLKIARQTLREAIQIDPGLATAHEAMGYCLFRLGEFDAAERSYIDALGCDWHLPRAQAGLGSICMIRFLKDRSQTNWRDRALEHWHQSLELDADQPRIRRLIERYRPRSTDPESVLLGQP